MAYQKRWVGPYPRTKEVHIVREWRLSTGEAVHLNPEGSYCYNDGTICDNREYLETCIPPGHHRELAIMWFEENFGAGEKAQMRREAKEKETEETTYRRKKGNYKESSCHKWTEWFSERPGWWNEIDQAQIGNVTYTKCREEKK